MKISVIIATYNRLEDLRRTLRAFLSQDYENKEIIVVDNNSNDGTKEIIPQEFPEIKYFWLCDNFNIRALNIAFQLTSGEIIWRCDSDSHPESTSTFTQIVEIFQKYPDISIIATDDIEMEWGGKAFNWYGKEVDKINVPEDGYPAGSFHGTGVAIRREVFENIGGFWGFGFEEMDFSLRAMLAGYKIRYFPNIRTLHYSRTTNRNLKWSWYELSKQYIRLNCKYLPFTRLFLRLPIIYFFELMQGLIRKFSLLTLLDASFTFISVALTTIRNERVKVPKEILQLSPLNNNIILSYWNYLKNLKIFKKKSK